MTDGGTPRPKLVDLFRPSRLFERVREHPRFVLPALLLSACTLVYVEIAARKALPYVVPELLDHTVITESELAVTLQRALRIGALGVPLLALPAGALLVWSVLRLLGRREGFDRVLALVSWAGLWLALGLLAKAALALATGRADPPVNLGAFFHASRPWVRSALALTNPFPWLAALWTVRGLTAFGATRLRAAVAGGTPWAAAWLVALGASYLQSAREAPDAPIPTDEWAQIVNGPITLRYPPTYAQDADRLLGYLATFAERLHTQLGVEPVPLRVYVFPDHRALERSTGERLPVLVTASVRGADLLYLEAPGRSLAVTPERALREALRYVGMLELARAAERAPRWFVEGFVHAAVFPGDARLDKEFRTALARHGIPHYDALLQPTFFLDPDGPLFARSLVDHIAYLNGPDAPEKILKDVIAGTTFRDALFTHAHLTTSALEAGWVDALRTVTRTPPSGAGPESTGAAPGPARGGATSPSPPARSDSVSPRLDEAAPFRQAH